MGSGCLKVTKYFLFLFNLLFLILGAVILGFGIWILADKTSFIAVLQMSSPSLKTGAYILIGVGALTMLMGFLGCLGAVNEIRCLLGLYFTCLMIILLAQVAAALVIYFQKEIAVTSLQPLANLDLSLAVVMYRLVKKNFRRGGRKKVKKPARWRLAPFIKLKGVLKDELSKVVEDLIKNYDPLNEDERRNLQDAWDYVQTQIACCGWAGAEDWENNEILKNKSNTEYPCSCSNISKDLVEGRGFCSLDDPVNGTATYADWPVHEQGCMDGVEQWLKDNLGVILGVCIGVAVIELLGMILSISLCKNIHSEDYTKVPKS